jgi:hypothetical protein
MPQAKRALMEYQTMALLLDCDYNKHWHVFAATSVGFSKKFGGAFIDADTMEPLVADDVWKRTGKWTYPEG